ncbi:MAG TPA: VOC family protein [Rhizomicrobium sp.]|nr:VOC family protein [Rhizomicrobium sp.]
MPAVSTFLWFKEKAEEAARFYVSLLPNSAIQSVNRLPGGMPVITVEFTLEGRPFTIMESAMGAEPFNNSVSIVILCDSQFEIDRLWAALLDGGSAMACGWLKDRYGVVWQITPRRLIEMIKDKDRAKAERALNAMNKMIKLDISELERAFAG